MKDIKLSNKDINNFGHDAEAEVNKCRLWIKLCDEENISYVEQFDLFDCTD